MYFSICKRAGHCMIVDQKIFTFFKRKNASMDMEENVLIDLLHKKSKEYV